MTTTGTAVSPTPEVVPETPEILQPIEKVVENVQVEVADVLVDEEKNQQRSWKDVCTGEVYDGRLVLDPDFFAGKVKICFGEGPAKTPCISFDRSIMDALASNWEHSLIFRPLGGRIRFEIIARKIKEALRIRGNHRISDLPKGYFLLKLKDKADYEHIIS